ncbi:SusD/RagB family nutrient-binding outer membrane lipoprotein [Formosa sp. S-31]|uniref:SusD/RagB family nutrient-binding outer membrane lipoprotein n=1 Tax=Formosa sp. S-31 TaxID=2790949 RepID=UPI003EBBC180
MKKILITALSFVVLSSCMSDDKYDDYNRDPKNPTQVEADFLFNAATKSLFDQMTSTNVNSNVYRLLAQYWTQTTYIDESNFDLNNRNIPQNHWSEMYRDVLLDLDTAKENVIADAELTQGEKDARLAQIEVLAVYTWQQMVDSFGDIPYSQALNASEYTLPVYDDAATIYEDLVSRINAAIPNLTGSGFGTDNIYGGDISAWAKFANSLKLRIGMRVADAPGMASLSQSAVESAVAAGVFTSNDDNATIAYAATTPNTNPLWVDLVQSGRSDFVAANTVVDIMNTLEDPRRDVYFDQNLDGDYVGGPYGDNNSFSNYTHIGALMHQPEFRGVLLDFAEVSFFLADASERGYNVGGTAAEHYNNAITASFEDWGVDGAAAYLSKSDVAYSSAAGDWKTKIGRQFWLAMYNRGFEGWTAWRTYDTPALNVPVNTGNAVPFRYTYPVNEQNLNETNWNAAATAIGGDAQSTKLFWDVN